MDLMAEFCDRRHLLQMDSLSKLDGKLKNIASGLVASANVNITNVKNCGESILKKMEGTSSLTFSFQKVMQTVQIPSSILAKQTKVELDPELLFQRLITVCSDGDWNDALKHELAHHPMSLFDDEGFMRDPKKAELAKYIVSEYTFHDVVPNIESKKWKIVVDGGMLLHFLLYSIHT